MPYEIAYEFSGIHLKQLSAISPERNLAYVTCKNTTGSFSVLGFKTTAFESTATPYLKRDLAFIRSETHNY